MLLIGNFGLTYDQSKTQMAIWAILAAPLLMSNKLTEVQPHLKDILQNKKVIEVNQDKLGIQGTRVFRDKGIDIWTRPVEPFNDKYHSYAVAFVSRRVDGAPYPYNITLEDLGLKNPNGYSIVNLYGKEESTTSCIFYPKTPVKVRVIPSGVVFLRMNIENSNEPCTNDSKNKFFV
jgi:hypothetical protein